MQNMNNAPRDDEMDLDFTEDLPTLRSDVPARQELSKIDVEILDISNLINQLELEKTNNNRSNEVLSNRSAWR